MMVTELNTAEIALSYAEISDIGGRQSNQDAYGYASRDEIAFFAVADGAGGHDGGEIAAKTVIDSAIASFAKHGTFSVSAMHAHIESAISGVQEAKVDQAHLKDMSATVAAVLP